ETRGGRIFCSFPAYETDAFCRRGFRGPSRGLRRRLPRDREAGGFRVFAGQLPPRRQALRRSLGGRFAQVRRRPREARAPAAVPESLTTRPESKHLACVSSLIN